MSILTRYLFRALAGPFLFAMSVLTGLLFFNSVAQRLGRLVGKGLGGEVIGEFLLLSLPHTVALTLPMAVLVAVLYAFADLAANNELTAIAAGGVKPRRLLLPVIVAGIAASALMLFFNDRVLPDSNHRLQLLGESISRKSPTFLLREQVVNEINPEAGPPVFLQAGRIRSEASELEEVRITEVAGTSTRTIYADSGAMAFNDSRTDLFLELSHGEVWETFQFEPERFDHMRFDKLTIPFRGIANEFERQEKEYRSDREMRMDQLAAAAAEARQQADSVREAMREYFTLVVRQTLGERVDPSTELPGAGERPSSGEESELDTLREDGAGAVIQGRTPPPRAGVSLGGAPVEDDEDPRVAGILTGQAGVSGQGRDAATYMLHQETIRRNVNVKSHLQSANAYLVEYHKKWAISFACLVFVLLGLPLGMRFPRGGVGMVIAVSVAIFAFYWAGLMGGEELGNRGYLRPWIAMWLPNALLLVWAAGLLARMGREGVTARGGGGIGDLLYRLQSRFGTLPDDPAPSRA